MIEKMVVAGRLICSPFWFWPFFSNEQRQLASLICWLIIHYFRPNPMMPITIVLILAISFSSYLKGFRLARQCPGSRSVYCNCTSYQQSTILIRNLSKEICTFRLVRSDPDLSAGFIMWSFVIVNLTKAILNLTCNSLPCFSS